MRQNAETAIFFQKNGETPQDFPIADAPQARAATSLFKFGIPTAGAYSIFSAARRMRSDKSIKKLTYEP